MKYFMQCFLEPTRGGMVYNKKGKEVLKNPVTNTRFLLYKGRKLYSKKFIFKRNFKESAPSPMLLTCYSF